ncbi:hydrolase [Seiridium cupressi]
MASALFPFSTQVTSIGQHGEGGARLDHSSRAKFTGWQMSLPSESNAYTVELFRIPMQDGVELVADLSQPLGAKPQGTILVRSPYGIVFPLSLSSACIYPTRGFQVLINACRGTSASGGQFRPGCDEAVDGLAVVSWMRDQPWYIGSFATLGGSYLSYTQFTILSEPPPDMKTAILTAGPHDWVDLIWGTGALNSDIVFWGGAMSNAQRGSWIPMQICFLLQKNKFNQAMSATSLIKGVDDFIPGGLPPWLPGHISTPDLADPKWENMEQNGAPEKVKIPVAIFTGWQDFALSQVMTQYSRLTGRGCPVSLTIGPWTHLGAQRGLTKLDSLK